jgi:5-methylcytosine-specific restriction endonuclease McrA
MNLPPGIRDAVSNRAKNRCEYCQLAQVGQEATFHVDHVIPRDVGGPTSEGNLALACVSCSLRKGARTHVEDPVTGELVGIFNPRLQEWKTHFRWEMTLSSA